MDGEGVLWILLHQVFNFKADTENRLKRFPQTSKEIKRKYFRHCQI